MEISLSLASSKRVRGGGSIRHRKQRTMARAAQWPQFAACTRAVADREGMRAFAPAVVIWAQTQRQGNAGVHIADNQAEPHAVCIA